MRFKVYQDGGGGYRWTLLAKNGEAIAVSSESYTRRADVNRAIRLMRVQVPFARVTS